MNNLNNLIVLSKYLLFIIILIYPFFESISTPVHVAINGTTGGNPSVKKDKKPRQCIGLGERRQKSDPKTGRTNPVSPAIVNLSGLIIEPLKLKTTDLLPRYVGQDKKDPNRLFRKVITYFYTPETRSPYLITLKKNKWYQNGKLLNGKNFILTQDINGNIYGTQENGNSMIKHPSFIAGKPAAFAGTAYFVVGDMIFITNNSGHYEQPNLYLNQFLQILRCNGIDTSTISIKYYNEEK